MKASKLEALGRRAVACPRWRWMPGMRALVGPTNAPYRYVTPEYAPPEGDSVGFCDPTPDLSDPATLGCLLHLVRKAWGRPFWVEGDPRSMGERPDEWIGVLFEGRFATCSVVHAATEAEALVAALEAAP